MLRIGEFAVLSSISIHMLRNYDKIGLLVPEYVDDSSGYRYYSREQLVTANRIVVLKSMGFGLKEIDQMIHMELEELNQNLKRKADSIAKEMEQLKMVQERIRQTILDDSREEEYALAVAVKTIPKHYVISYTGKIHHFWDEGELWQSLTAECEQHGIKISENTNAEARWVKVDSEEVYKEIEVRFWTEQRYKDIGKLHAYPVNETCIASLVFYGSYMQIPRINLYVAHWLEQNGYELCGDIFFVYHKSPKDSHNEDELLSEMCFPIQKIL